MHRLAAWACVAGKVEVEVGMYQGCTRAGVLDTVYITIQALLRGNTLANARAGGERQGALRVRVVNKSVVVYITGHMAKPFLH
jgi:hypothetical protein